MDRANGLYRKENRRIQVCLGAAGSECGSRMGGWEGFGFICWGCGCCCGQCVRGSCGVCGWALCGDFRTVESYDGCSWT